MKPILFNTAMVSAILQGRKTQTRRPIKPRSKYRGCWFINDEGLPEFEPYVYADDGILVPAPCAVGDVLYVRERWRLVQPIHPEEYHFGYADMTYSANPASEKYDYSEPYKWHPSIHMPKEAARIFLQVTSVKTEEIQNVSEADAIAEGFSSRSEFLQAFEAIYSKKACWVWVITFKVISL